MQSQERELIGGLFGRLQPFESQARDGEAEALIKDLVARQPAAPYLLVQTVLVQEQALKAAQERIAELEAKAGAAAPAASGLLGSAPKIGPWGGGQPAAAPRGSVPSTRSPLQSAVGQQPAGGSFLRTAMATAAGVAGGALLFEGIRSLMGSNPGPFGQTAAAPPAAPTPADNVQQAWGGADSNPMPDDLRNNDYDTAAYDDGDTGGSSDDWA
ncbi:MAG: DUF2076 domain-containing protein [Alphaproteobacteria bacterium]|nr:DUF2076 domain-containing protein [Alphaproteobacteria bacterium]